MKDKKKTSVNFNEALFTNMTFFTDAVWALDVATQKIEILHDKIQPELEGSVKSLEDARQHFIECNDPEDVKEILFRLSTEFLTNLKTSITYESRSFKRNEEKHTLRHVMTPEFDKKGRVKTVFFTFQDVQSHSNFKTDLTGVTSALNNTDVSSMVYHPKENKIYFSKRACQIYHCSSTYEDAPFSFAEEFVNEESRQVFISMFDHINSGKPSASSLFYNTDKSLRIHATMTTTKKDSEGNPEEVFCIIEDETKTYNAIQEKEKYQKELDRYLSAVTCGIIQYTRDTHKVVYANQIALDLMGYPSVEELEKHSASGIAESVNEEDAKHIKTLVSKLKNEKQIFDFEYRINHDNGEELICYGTVHLINREKDEPIIQRSMIDITEIRRSANKALILEATKETARQAQENLDTINSIIGSGMWYIEFDHNGKMSRINWSDKFRQMLGYSNASEFPNVLESWSDKIHPDDRESTLEKFYSCINGKKQDEWNFRMKLKNGTYNWFNVVGRVLCYENGKPRLFLGTFINVTMTEKKNQDYNSRLGAFLGGVNGGLVIKKYKKPNDYVYVSPQAAAILGYTPEEMIIVDKGCSTGITHPDDIEKCTQEVFEQVAESDSYTIKYRLKHKDGSWIWISDYGKRMTTDNGDVLVYSLLQDINEQEIQKQQLAFERSQFRDALTKNSLFSYGLDLTDGWFRKEVYTHDGTPIFASNNISLPISYNQHVKTMIEACDYEFLDHDSERITTREVLLEEFEKGISQIESHIYSKTMKVFNRIMLLMNRNENDNHVYLTVIIHDETVSRKEEAKQRLALQEALAASEQASRAKTVFLNNMSHDIRTPMNAIIGFTDLASMNINNAEKALDYLQKIQTSSKHLLSLINDVLDMSRIESGKVQIKEAPVSFEEIIEDIKSLVQDDTEIHGQDLLLDISKVQDKNIWCDKLRLNQILLNCISNSVKFTPKGGTVSLAVRQIPCPKSGYGSYQFVISDTGIGMSAEFLSHVFEPFERERTSTVSGIQGTGLGMSITKNLVDMMRGDIKVKSTQGVGTQITITLTFQLTADETALHENENEGPGKSLEGLKILLVEDNELNLEIATEILKNQGVDVDTANDGSIALEKMIDEEPERYDLILMDVQMPVMDGYEATRCIRRLHNPKKAQIPIIAMTANAFEEDRRVALEAGMNEHLAKPINPELLLKAVAKWI